MIKRTLFFANPAYLSTKNEQLIINQPNGEEKPKIISIEDIGFLVLEHSQITITNSLLAKLTQNKTVIINCDKYHLPVGILLPLEGHTEQNERFRAQVKASLPLKKNLWQQTVQAKIKNQGAMLRRVGYKIDNMQHWASKVTSGDSGNHEARAAAFYWQHLFDIPDFTRFRSGIPPNNLLNYGYAILRAVCARALVSTGLHPSMGIHHANKYNAYCLVDDVMEPYRPYVDQIVFFIIENYENYEELTTELNQELLAVPVLDVVIDGKKSPLMHAMARTTFSLYECYVGNIRKLLYPVYE